MSLNLQKVVSSQTSYEKLINKTLQSIQNEQDQQNMLRNIVLFCKQVFTSNANQRKKYLCLMFLKDIFEVINSEYFYKLVDEYLASKLNNIVQSYLQNRNRQSRTGTEDRETSQKTYSFALETINFWAKRLSFLQKSNFSQVYDELKKINAEFPQQFRYYRKDMLINLWNSGNHQKIQLQQSNPILLELHSKFISCKQQLESTINQSILNDQQVLVKPIVQRLRDFLIYFFNHYKSLQSQQTHDRDTIIVFFHILNNLYKKICTRIYLSIQETYSIITDAFQATYPTQYDSVDRMDIIELAGVFKYNALTIFQRIHQRIQKEDALLGPFKLSLNLEQSQPLKMTGLQQSKKNGHPSITYLNQSKKSRVF